MSEVTPAKKFFTGETTGDKLLRWHRELCQTTGAIVLTHTKRRLIRVLLETWAVRLEKIAAEMRAALKEAE